MSQKKFYTLMFLRKQNEILLGWKKRGFGANKWNGFGGKIEKNETVLEAGIREMNEESCVSVKKDDVKTIGKLEFIFQDDPVIMDVTVFSASIYNGVPTETEEMKPRWFNIQDIPYKDMWPDDQYWFPYMLKGITFCGQFHYKGFDTILNYKITELSSINDLGFPR